jgi:SAM-dependent methyltransferase
MADLDRRLERRYDELLASSCLDHDPFTRPTYLALKPHYLGLSRAIGRFLEGPRETIVDIGCHNGFSLALAREHGFRRFVGIDYFALPPERSFLTGLENASLIRANFNEDHFLKDLPDASVDVVLSIHVIEHVLHHPLGYLLESWRVLRPGGLLILSTPNPCTIANAVRLARGQPIGWGGVPFAKVPKLSRDGEAMAAWDIHFREYAASELDEIVAELPGRRVLERGYYVTAPAPNDGLGSRVAKSLVRLLGLDRWRPLASTQYVIVRRDSLK